MLRPGVIDAPVFERTVAETEPPPAEAAPEAVPPPDAPDAPAASRPAAAAAEETSPEAARSWERVVGAGKSASIDEVHEVAPTGVGTGVMIEDLSQRELQEFAKLLRAEMGGLQ